MCRGDGNSVAYAMGTKRSKQQNRHAHSARYCRVYAKLVHKGRQQKNPYLQPLVARKRWSSRRGNPMWLPGGGRPHRAAPRQSDGPTHSFGIDTLLPSSFEERTFAHACLMTPAFSSRAIFSCSKPATSRNTSTVCCPKSGATYGRVAGVRENLAKTPVCRTSPHCG